MSSNHGERLKEERLRIGLSQVDFVEKIGASKTTIFTWEKSETYPNSLQLEKMSKMGMDILYIVTGERLLNLDGSEKQPETYYYIPVYSTEVYTTDNTSFFDHPPLYHHAFRKVWIDQHHYHSQQLAVIKIQGDSMIPVLQNGEYVLLNRESIVPKTGRIFIVKIGNELLAKYIEVQINGTIVLKSRNDFYREIVLTPNDLEQGNVQNYGGGCSSISEF